jgi:hypothetical protein
VIPIWGCKRPNVTLDGAFGSAPAPFIALFPDGAAVQAAGPRGQRVGLRSARWDPQSITIWDLNGLSRGRVCPITVENTRCAPSECGRWSFNAFSAGAR